MSDFSDFDPAQLYFIPLGGSEQFGTHMNVYGTGGKWLAVDCGIGFANEHFPGIDILLPDPLFLEERRKDLVGLVLTHAHEDHQGAAAYLWSRLKCPIYCSPFVAAILRRKFDEMDPSERKGLVIHEVAADQKLVLGPFTLNFVGVTHSTVEAMSLVVETAAGRVVHTGDWNDDPTPVIGGLTNAEAFKAAGRKGVLAYVGDSTNAASSGQMMSEKALEQSLTQVLRDCPGRVVVTLFSYSIPRIQSMVRAAASCGRQVALVGRSLHNATGAAISCGYLKGLPPFVDVRDLARQPDHAQLILVTGSQGEPRAALARIARGEHRDVKLKKGDTVIFSSRDIPGNELRINAIRNSLMVSGVTVLTRQNSPHPVYASGHPYPHEIAQMFDWIRPQIAIPVHGERVQLQAHADLAARSGVPHVILPENGAVICLSSEEGPCVEGAVPVGVLLVEPGRIVGIRHRSLSERRKLQESGALHITAVLGKKGRAVAPLSISAVGLFDAQSEDDSEILRELTRDLEALLEELRIAGTMADPELVREEIRIGARRAMDALLGLKPQTTVHVVVV